MAALVFWVQTIQKKKRRSR